VNWASYFHAAVQTGVGLDILEFVAIGRPWGRYGGNIAALDWYLTNGSVVLIPGRVNMGFRFMRWAAFGTLVGCLSGYALKSSKGDMSAPIVMGLVGFALGMGGLAFVSIVHRGLKWDRPMTNLAAIVAPLGGAVVGGCVGAVSNLGRVMLAIFNPDLPEMDFLITFGAIGGVFIGAVVGVCLVPITGALVRRVKAKQLRSDETVLDPDSTM